MHRDSLPDHHALRQPSTGTAPAAAAERLSGKGTRRRSSASSTRKPRIPPTPLAFVFATEGDIQEAGDGRAVQLALPLRHVAYPYTVASWSTEASSQLQALRSLLMERYKRDQATAAERPFYQLPHTSLRARLELRDEGVLRLDYNLGLYGRAGSPILWTRTDEHASRETLNGALLGWLNEDVVRLNALADHAPAMHCVDALKDLARARAAIATRQVTAHPFQWTITPSGTTKPSEPSRGYAELAEYVARQLEGCEVFPGLAGAGRLRRIITGDLHSGEAELMTDPTSVTPQKGSLTWFSLVVRVQVLTFPGRPQPVIAIGFSRRVWTSGLKERAWGDARISAYALPEGATRALRFTLSRRPGSAGHQPEADFEPIARRYFAGRKSPTVDDMLTTGHLLAGCKLLIGQRHGVAERSDVQSGVPDLDKLVAFERISDQVRPLCLVPWTGLEPIVTPTATAGGRMQHWAKRTSARADERKLYETWQREITQSVQACYSGGVYELVIGVQGSAQADAEEAARLLAAYVNDASNDASAEQGRMLRVRLVPIPALTHGPRNELPARDKARSVRAEERARRWQDFIDAVRRDNAEHNRRVDGVLILAHKWYASQRQRQGKPSNVAPDDVVNKRAARIAIARGLGVPVQYLRPQRDAGDETAESSSRHELPDRAASHHAGGSTGHADDAGSGASLEALPTQSKTPRFHRRLMSAWLMLAFGTKGYVRRHKIQAGIEQTRQKTRRVAPPGDAGCDQDHDQDHDQGQVRWSVVTAPDRVLALSVVRQNTSRLTGAERSFLPCAIELDVASGLCTASFAYEQASDHQLVCTQPLPLPQALVSLAKLGPVTLAELSQNGAQLQRRTDLLRQRAQAFFNARLADITRRSERPLVLIHANTARHVWPWLTDERLDPDNVQIGDVLNAQAAWPHLRLVRVRMDNSPKVLRDKSSAIPATDPGTDTDTADGHEPQPQAGEYRTPNWAQAQVYRLTDTAAGTPVYLSFGTLLRKLVRGTSSYRAMQGTKLVQLEGQQKKTRVSATLDPYTGAWHTPLGVELVVVRSDGEDPDQLASLVEWLRQCYLHIGDWTNKPAPLYFDGQLKRYLADYDLDVEDEDGDGDGDDESDAIDDSDDDS